MKELTEAAAKRLADGDSAFDVVEFAVAGMESSGIYVAGRGSAPNTAGHVELDASIMNGADRAAGAVASIRDVTNPISVARRVMEATPHVMLSGTGATVFASDQGFPIIEDPRDYYVLPEGVDEDEVDEITHGTVGAVACDGAGRLAAATSTGGTFGKLQGRVGDTPLIGSGTWADEHVAVSCTGVGEYFIRTGAAIAVSHYVRAGASLGEAVDDVLGDVAGLGGDGGIIAVSRHAEIVMSWNSDGMKRASVREGGTVESATFES
jgi:isoaspartyl peptidase/L-asparaginase-like protein (Ntn-hydrolase superfamily)